MKKRETKKQFFSISIFSLSLSLFHSCYCNKWAFYSWIFKWKTIFEKGEKGHSEMECVCVCVCVHAECKTFEIENSLFTWFQFSPNWTKQTLQLFGEQTPFSHTHTHTHSRKHSHTHSLTQAHAPLAQCSNHLLRKKV